MSGGMWSNLSKVLGMSTCRRSSFLCEKFWSTKSCRRHKVTILSHHKPHEKLKAAQVIGHTAFVRCHSW
jgi:hypothetical protein